MILKISKLAFLEIEDAKDYYNLQKTTLGDNFKEDIKKSIKNIKNFPNLYPNITDDLKRCVLHRFPYSIFFLLQTIQFYPLLINIENHTIIE